MNCRERIIAAHFLEDREGSGEHESGRASINRRADTEASLLTRRTVDFSLYDTQRAGERVGEERREGREKREKRAVVISISVYPADYFLVSPRFSRIAYHRANDDRIGKTEDVSLPEDLGDAAQPLTRRRGGEKLRIPPSAPRDASPRQEARRSNPLFL